MNKANLTKLVLKKNFFFSFVFNDHFDELLKDFFSTVVNSNCILYNIQSKKEEISS